MQPMYSYGTFGPFHHLEKKNSTPQVFIQIPNPRYEQ